MTVDELIRRPGAWLLTDAGPDTEIAVSARIRLARNLQQAAFPSWAGEEECVRILSRLRPAVESLPFLDGAWGWEMSELDPVDREILCERHLISAELASRNRGSAVVLRSDESLSVMINEEDHLRLQVMRPGANLMGLWQEIDAFDTALGELVPYAFSPELGYLTACPSNVGTGLRASVMVHLPALRLMREVEPVVKGLNKIGLAVRGIGGEGTEAMGNMFQVSNQMTLGEGETDLIRRLDAVVQELTTHERNARARLLEKHPARLRDFVGRAFGVLMQAHILNSQEALDLLSALRLGIEMELVRSIGGGDLNRLMQSILPGHLQRQARRDLPVEDRDQLRAMMVRERLKETGAEPAF
jgi:protein arginine kinase